MGGVSRGQLRWVLGGFNEAFHGVLDFDDAIVLILTVALVNLFVRFFLFFDDRQKIDIMSFTLSYFSMMPYSCKFGSQKFGMYGNAIQ